MSTVKLGDIAIESRDSLKEKDKSLPVVGLEHLIPEQINLTDWNIGQENTFTKTFEKGDVLFGRRRAYLKKAAVAPCKGICSGDITVIRAKEDNILPEILPFVIQNDVFFDFAVGKSAGSLSPRVKWEHLANYEFNLPELEEQKKLAEVLWQIVDTMESYKKLLAKTDEMVKAKFVEMFGDMAQNNKQWTTKPFIEVFKDDTKNGKKINLEDYLTKGSFPIIDQSQNYINGYWNDGTDIYKNVPVIIFGDHTRCLKYINTPFFLGADGVKILKLINKDNYLFMLHQLKNSYIPNTGYNRHFKWLLQLNLICPPIEIQNQFADFVQKSEESKAAIQASLDSLSAVYKKIIAENLGGK